jgi:hypothetical protein
MQQSSRVKATQRVISIQSSGRDLYKLLDHHPHGDFLLGSGKMPAFAGQAPSIAASQCAGGYLHDPRVPGAGSRARLCPSLPRCVNPGRVGPAPSYSATEGPMCPPLTLIDNTRLALSLGLLAALALLVSAFGLQSRLYGVLGYCGLCSALLRLVSSG